MTLVLEGTPSSGGPRCLRSRGAAGCLAESLLVSASFVVSVRGATWPGTFVGVLSAGAASVSSICSASPPSAFYRQVSSSPSRRDSESLQRVRHVQRGHHVHVHGRGRESRHGGAARCRWRPRHRCQRPRREPRGCGQAGSRPCGRGWPCRSARQWHARPQKGWKGQQRHSRRGARCAGWWGWWWTRCATC